MTHREGTPADGSVPPETAQAALKNLLASPRFSNSRRLSEFLRCIAQKAIAGQTADIGERLIATEIYGRRPDYDPAVDSIVRVEANRLRAKLREYYEGEGCDDAVRVRLPLDSYAPVFEAAPSPVASELAAAATHKPWRIALVVALAAAATMGALVPLSRRAADSRSSIAVLPFANTGGLAEKDYFSDGLTERIADRLARSGELQVAARGSAQRFRKPGEDVRRIGRQLHVDQERRILDLDPHVTMAQLLLERGYEGLGRYGEAEAILKNALEEGNSAGAMADLGHVYAVSGKRDRALGMIDALTRMAKSEHVSPYHLAFIQTGLGNRSEALALLEMSYEQHEAPLAFLRVDPRWDPLRGDGRFQQLLRELSLDK
jgi:tetratricopeptide (TPR) repeat protein